MSLVAGLLDQVHAIVEIIGIHAIVSANDRIHVIVRFRKQPS